MKPPVFNCPSCGNIVEGRADYIARGLKCPACGIGFMPVTIEPRREIGIRSEPAWLKWIVCGLLLLLSLPLFYIFWPVAVVLLLGAITFLLWRLARA